jgi:hypothetical protein
LSTSRPTIAPAPRRCVSPAARPDPHPNPPPLAGKGRVGASRMGASRRPLCLMYAWRCGEAPCRRTASSR